MLFSTREDVTFAIEIYAFVVYYRMNVAHLDSRINASHGERLYNNVGLFISGIGLSFLNRSLFPEQRKITPVNFLESRRLTAVVTCSLCFVCLFGFFFCSSTPPPCNTVPSLKRLAQRNKSCASLCHRSVSRGSCRCG